MPPRFGSRKQFKEGAEEQLLLRRPRRIGHSVTLPPDLDRVVNDFLSKHPNISFTRLVEAIVRHYITDEGLMLQDDRIRLIMLYDKLVAEMGRTQKLCGKYYDEIRRVYKDELHGKPDLSNAEVILPQLMNHFGQRPEVRSRLPFFELHVKAKLEAQQVLKRLEETKKVERVEGKPNETDAAS